MTSDATRTDAELNKAAAEAMGWTYDACNTGGIQAGLPFWWCPDNIKKAHPPRFSTDMNAAIELAEHRVGGGKHRSWYVRRLRNGGLHAGCDATDTKLVIIIRDGNSPHDPDHKHDPSRALCRAVLAAIAAEAEA